MLAVAVDVQDERADFVPAPAVHQDVAEIVGARLLVLQDVCSSQHVETVPFLAVLDELAVESYRVHHESRLNRSFWNLVFLLMTGMCGFGLRRELHWKMRICKSFQWPLLRDTWLWRSANAL
jgi:hypothetical protein